MGRLLGRSGLASGPDGFLAPAGDAARHPAHSLAEKIDERFAPLVEPVEVVNPLSRDSEVLRTSSFATLLETVAANLRLGNRDVLLFEIGHSYVPRPGDLPEERRVLTVATGATRTSPEWGRTIANDFYWLKGVAETVLDRLAIGPRHYRPLRHPLFHPARSAGIVLPGPVETPVGVLGEVEPDVRARFDLDEPAYLLALDLDALLPLATRGRQVVPVSRFPANVQDVAVVVPSTVTSESIEDLIRQTGLPLVKSVDLFDVYQGSPIPAGKINLAYHITYQAPDRTLTDAEVAAVHHRIEQALVGQLAAELRA
jgi:phenylalanyl-tRNA synthetase beta chain